MQTLSLSLLCLAAAADAVLEGAFRAIHKLIQVDARKCRDLCKNASHACLALYFLIDLFGIERQTF
jgi:hypothetical protein